VFQIEGPATSNGNLLNYYYMTEYLEYRPTSKIVSYIDYIVRVVLTTEVGGARQDFIAAMTSNNTGQEKLTSMKSCPVEIPYHTGQRQKRGRPIWNNMPSSRCWTETKRAGQPGTTCLPADAGRRKEWHLTE